MVNLRVQVHPNHALGRRIGNFSADGGGAAGAFTFGAFVAVARSGAVA